jgi:hypothetical protein
MVALNNLIPTIDITHHSKNRNFLLENNLSNISIDYANLSKDKLIKTAQSAEAMDYRSNIINISAESIKLWDNFKEEWTCFCNEVITQ